MKRLKDIESDMRLLKDEHLINNLERIKAYFLWWEKHQGPDGVLDMSKIDEAFHSDEAVRWYDMQEMRIEYKHWYPFEDNDPKLTARRIIYGIEESLHLIRKHGHEEALKIRKRKR